jgi:hypothetical protein
MPVREEDGEFKGSLAYIARPCLKRKKTYKKQKQNNNKGPQTLEILLTLCIHGLK